MATDIEVQYFSHLNGLVLGNNWGDMIRLLDTCLVNGLPFSAITSASIDEQGDITLNFYSEHKAMLFQIVELTGFTPGELNGKYRIKGTPTATQLILKATHIGKTVTATGSAKLASLGYDIIFRDASDVKRVYRAKNPRSEHPFIRVDESLSGEGGGSYPSTYAKYAMVGLLENMNHIDDYQGTSKLQLPLDTTDFTKNWKVSGTGSGVIRGWSRWYWSRSVGVFSGASDTAGGYSASVKFSLCGSKDAFYLLSNVNSDDYKILKGCGIFDASLVSDIIPPWFLMSLNSTRVASESYQMNQVDGATPLTGDVSLRSIFYVPKYNVASRIQNSDYSRHLSPDGFSGFSGVYSSNNIAALQLPFFDSNKYLRGTLKHICYAGNNLGTPLITSQKISENSMYIYDALTNVSNNSVAKGGVYFYIGELQ